MSGYEITCVNKDQRGFIFRVGGSGWSLSLKEAVVKIVTNQIRLHIFWNDEYKEIGVCGEGQDAFLCLADDSTSLHLLEGLPSC